ncbi:MAG TPA: DUF2652 domain-containing protein [Chryseolinea sp.]|nr:DUF2652 domain-containing protein [Chryseolinea sp.]
MTPTTQKGFLILADITGFTPFVATTELEHSQEILRHMLNGIISFLTPVFTLAEVEGDAVFVYLTDSKGQPNSPAADIGSQSRLGEMVPDVIESMYYSYRDKKNSFHRARTCECNACQMAATLDLKFVVHYGEYIMNNAGGKDKPLGPSVNVAHRLLKNHVTEATGWKAYALFTKECVSRIGLNVTEFHHGTEMFEHIGSVETFSVDLNARYKGYLSERTVYISSAEADFVVQKDFPVAPALLWEWFNDPKRKTLWSEGSNWNILSRPAGRMGRGSTNHCVNSKVIETILDYRPFEYYTSKMGRGPLNFTSTFKFEAIPQGCRLFWYIKMNGILPTTMKRSITKLLLEKGMGVHRNFKKLLALIEAEKLKSEVTYYPAMG